MVTQLVKKFPAFYETRRCSHEPATGPHPEPDDFSPPHLPTLLPYDPFQYYFILYKLRFVKFQEAGTDLT
jgi:hypothetical protein